MFAVLAVYQLLRFVVLGLFVAFVASETSGPAVVRGMVAFGGAAVVMSVLAVLKALSVCNPLHQVLRVGKSVELGASIYAVLPGGGIVSVRTLVLLAGIAFLDAIALAFLVLSNVDAERQPAVPPKPVVPPSLPEVDTIEIEEE